MTKEKVLAKLAEGRQALLQAIEGLSEEEMTQVQVEGVWTIKDVLGHITTWEETCLEPLQHYADGGPYDVQIIEDHLAWNDVQAARKRAIPLDVILGELATVRQRLVEAASRLSARQLERRVPFSWGGEGTVAETLERLHKHELGHVRNIQQWR